MATTKQMTETEIAQLVGAGPYTFVRGIPSMHTSPFVKREACDLCNTACTRGIMFSSADGREFVVGFECAKWIPGERRAVSQAIAQMKREREQAKLVIVPGVKRCHNGMGYHTGWKLTMPTGDVLRAKPIVNAFAVASDGTRVRIHACELDNRDRTRFEATTDAELETTLREWVMAQPA